MKLQGARVIVTGGAIRVGAAIVRNLAENGAHIFLHYNTSQNEAQNLFESIGGSHAHHTLLNADLNTKAGLDKLLPLIPSCNVLINNASIYHYTGDPQTFSRVNAQVPMELTRHLTHGCAIQLLDGGIQLDANYTDAYPKSKQVLAQSILPMAREYAPHVRINGIALGPVLPPTHLPEADMSQFKARLPLQQTIPLHAVTSAVRFLIEQDLITGNILYLDGGLHMLNA